MRFTSFHLRKIDFGSRTAHRLLLLLSRVRRASPNLPKRTCPPMKNESICHHESSASLLATASSGLIPASSLQGHLTAGGSGHSPLSPGSLHAGHRRPGRLSRRILRHSLALSLAVFALDARSNAAVVNLKIVIAQVGSDVVATTTGSLPDLAGLTFGATTTSSSLLAPGLGRVLVGSSGPFTIYSGPSFTGSLGTGTTNISATSSSGLQFGMNAGGSRLWLAGSYIPGNEINSTSVWANKTLADLGLTVGNTVTGTWNAGTRSMSVSVVPEPSTFALGGLSAMALVFFRNRRRSLP